MDNTLHNQIYFHRPDGDCLAANETPKAVVKILEPPIYNNYMFCDCAELPWLLFDKVTIYYSILWKSQTRIQFQIFNEESWKSYPNAWKSFKASSTIP